MDQINILDRSGDWFFNGLSFPFVDMQGQVFKQGFYTQATPSDWTEMQVACGVLTKVKRSPLLTDKQIAELDAAEAEAEAAAKAAAEAAAKAAAKAPAATSEQTQAPAKA